MKQADTLYLKMGPNACAAAGWWSRTVIYALVGNFLYTDSTHQGDFQEHCEKAFRLFKRMTLSEQNYIDTAVISLDFYLVSRPVTENKTKQSNNNS